jgi:peptidoglycan/LPS O-acetylase OafA/YrhL
MKSSNITYLPAVDHIRGFAAITVIVYHGLCQISYLQRFNTSFTLANWLESNYYVDAFFIEGHTAVGWFMVLSGFIFTLGSMGKKVNYWGFQRNRLFRTYPLMLVLLFAGIHTFPADFTLEGFFLTIGGLANVGSNLKLGAFTTLFWTIGVEWQFYLLFPFLIASANRKGPSILVGMLLTAILLRFGCVLSGAEPRDISYWTIIGRIDQFLIGMLAAYAYRANVLRGKSADLAFGVSIFILFLSLYGFNKSGGWPVSNIFKIFLPTCEGFIWACVTVAYLGVAYRIPKFLSRLFVWAGTISYSLYLTHFIIILQVIKHDLTLNFSEEPILNGILNSVLIVLPLTILPAAMLYQYVEKPFLMFRGKYNDLVSENIIQK